MKKITPKDLKVILSNHSKWLLQEDGGGRADLSNCDLSELDLSGANLQWANLQWATLDEVNLFGANLSGANLRGAVLFGANLRGANLIDANLLGANLRRAELDEANLSGANLRRAELDEANLSGATLQWADLDEANLSGAKLPSFQLPDGELIVYKKLANGVIATLQIPSDARRTASLIGNKCRCEAALVLELSNGAKECGGYRDSSFIYKVGEMVIPDSYNDDIRVECTHGIHFFVSRQDAEEY